MVSSSSVLVGWCRPRRRQRRRRGSTIRLGSRRRGFWLGTRPPAVKWGLVAAPLRLLKRMIMDLAPDHSAASPCLEAYFRNLPFLRPQIFPLC
ncbi:unnamed protein product [Linum tenue]|uniref:Uncharacterized protein n=1 Tax=Linum tenue TaxID=586396 RepID=A0AAV0KXH8_9ROSI|nr:unnamed protein product [Linum tenue]